MFFCGSESEFTNSVPVNGVADWLLPHEVIRVPVLTVNLHMAREQSFFHVVTIIFFKVIKVILKLNYFLGRG